MFFGEGKYAIIAKLRVRLNSKEVAEIQSCKDSRLQRFKVAKIQKGCVAKRLG